MADPSDESERITQVRIEAAQTREHGEPTGPIRAPTPEYLTLVQAIKHLESRIEQQQQGRNRDSDADFGRALRRGPAPWVAATLISVVMSTVGVLTYFEVRTKGVVTNVLAEELPKRNQDVADIVKLHTMSFAPRDEVVAHTEQIKQLKESMTELKSQLVDANSKLDRLLQQRGR